MISVVSILGLILFFIAFVVWYDFMLTSTWGPAFVEEMDNMRETGDSGRNYNKNIEWVSHPPKSIENLGIGEVEVAGGERIDIGSVDLDGDGKDELVKVIWGEGISDHSLKIEVSKGGKVISTLRNEFGIQPNFRIEDMDIDNKKEIVIWSGLWDFRLPNEDGVTEETYEGHSDPHRYVVATYKLIRGEYYLWDVYTTQKKYEPYCEKQPI